jgi:hypothetical protein
MLHYLKNIASGISILAFLFVSCKNTGTKQSTAPLLGNLPSQLIDSLQQPSQQVQKKEINPSRDNIMIGTKGTRFLIPANSILDEKGNTVTGNVIFEVQENYSFSDFITNNLQTVHNDDLLQTQGMVYFTALSKDGKTLAINKNKPIRIEFPVNNSVAETKIFKGSRDAIGNMNWDSIAEPNKLLLPFPIHSLAPNPFGECYHDFGITKDRKYYNEHDGKNYFMFDSIEKYENTLLATREFKERYYSYCMPDITKIYIANLDKNMWEIDNLMVKYFIKDSTERVNISIAYKPRSFNGQPVTKEQVEAYQSLITQDKIQGHYMIEAFKRFAAQKLTRIDTTQKVDTSVIRETTTAFVSYQALDFGWVNVDYFYKDPAAQKIKLIGTTNIEPMTVNLIIPARKIVVTGILKSDKTYWFTKQEDGYNKLPKREKAFIVCLGIKDNKLFFVEKEIIIGQNEIENLTLTETRAAMIKTKLESYGR